MKTQRLVFPAILVLCSASALHAQNDGDHCITDNSGTTYLATDAQQPSAPFNVTIGTTPSTLATLNVRGDQLPVADPFFGGPRLCTFRTDVAALREQSWWMYRDANHIGRIWADGGHRAFHFQNMEPADIGMDRYSGAMVQNHQNDGLWVVQNGLPEGVRLFPNAAQVLNRDGYAALGASEGWLAAPTATDIRGPWSRLHLFDQAVGTRPYFGWRSQMRNGMLFTGNSDLGYMGHWYDQGESGSDTPVDDNSKIVFGIAENALPAGLAHHQDHFSFRFFSNLAGSDGAASTLNGLEMMRIRPYRPQAEGPVQGLVGIGDFLTPGDGPTESLDVRGGKVRIRELPTDAVSTSNEYVTVNTTTGVLEHRPLPPSATAGCEWELLSGNRIATGYAAPGMNGSCPDRRWRIGIGTLNPNYKVDVFHTEAEASISGGLSMDLRTNSNSFRYGIRSSVIPVDQTASLTYAYSIFGELGNLGQLSPGTSSGIAVLGKSSTDQARYITNSVGVGGDAVASNGTIVSLQGGAFSSRGTGGSLTEGIGAYCWVNQNTSAGSMANGYGVWASSAGATTNYALYGYAPGSTNWAGYFVGRSFTSAGAWTPSDESLKSDVEPIGSAMERLMQLEPKTYVFNHEAHQQMGLPQEQQYGFMAQELAEVFPEFVTDAIHPAKLDSLGAVVHPAVEFKAVNVDGLTPVIVAAMKEQQAVIEELRAELMHLREEVSNCCANPDGVRSLPQGNTEPTGLGSDLTGTDKLRIQPNPFNERTTVYYTLDRGGRTQLLANSSDGRELRVLQEANLEAGSYQFEWDTASLAPGLYYVTLLIDGEPVVKKAVKVDR